MTSLLQTGLNGHLPAPTEKRFLISNTPEFGAGSHTFNEVFGLTRNPYDLSRSCGGSSGGAAVALGWSPDLGLFPVEPVVIEAIERALPVFGDLGCDVEENHPDFSGAAEVFQILRAELFASSHEDELRDHRSQIKDTVVWNIEEGLKLSAMDVAHAQERRAELYHRLRHFFETYDYLVLPVSQVAPFPVEMKWIREINGVPMESYIDWMQSCSLISLTEHPAMSVPCGFTPAELPVGIQMVGRHRGERELLQLAHAFEQATGVGERRPEVALL